NAASDSASASAEVRAAAIDIAKTADAPSVSAGDTIGFSIVVTNGGTGTARNVTVSDLLPTDAGTSWSIDSSTEPSCAIAAGTLSCGPVDLGPGLSFTVHISSPTTRATPADSPVDNSATVTTSNDGSDHVDHVQITVNCPNLQITKTADAPLVSAGDPIGFTINLQNTGAGTAHNVSITDPLPSGSGVTWSVSPPAS